MQALLALIRPTSSHGLRARAVHAARVIRNAVFDLRFGGLLGGVVPSRYAELGAVQTENSDYAALPRIFGNRIRASDVLVDVGCGKGRVINWWLGQGLRNPMIGIELDPEIAAQTRRRLRRHPNVTIMAGNAVDCLPHHGTLFYLYNPFNADVMRQFRDRLLEVATHHDVRILYYRCVHVDVFTEDPRWQVELFDVGGDPALPFDRCAEITLRREAVGQDSHPAEFRSG
jgi:hypothetical protein